MHSISKKTDHLNLDERSISIFRIFLGISILYSLIIIKFPYTIEFWGKDRLIPIEIMQAMNGKDAFSIFDYIQNDSFAYFWMISSIILSILYTLGIQTRIVSVLLLFFFFNILQAYARYNNGFDKYTFQMLTWSCFLPLNNYFSLQKIINRKKVNQLISFIIIIQICFIYFSTGIVKYGDAWKQGYAVKILASEMWYPGKFASFFTNNEFLYTILTYATLFFEITFPIFILVNYKNNILRYVGIIFLLGFHISIFFISDVGNFSITGVAVALLLLPNSFWKKINIKLKESSERIFSKSTQYIFIVCTAFVLYTFVQKNLLFISNTYHLYDRNSSAINRFLQKIDVPQIAENSFQFQYWKMFAPNPASRCGWLSIEYEGDDGLFYDLFTNNIISRTEHKVSFIPKRQERYLLSYARMFKLQDIYYSRVFLKYWFFRQLEKRNIPKSDYHRYYLAEYRAEFSKNSTIMNPIEKELYTYKAIENLDISLPKKKKCT
ncbi:MAG: HTTM domain-containing protein [Sphingobacteriales bacterium]|nr:MAG: HTTM domain-containing protein [Sphingobacteriales bacterium]